MKIFNEKPLSQIKEEREQKATEPLLDLYEAIIFIGEELDEMRMKNEELEAEVAALKGGSK